MGVACQINAKGGRGVWFLAGSQPGHTCIREAHRLAAGLLASRRAESASRCTVTVILHAVRLTSCQRKESLFANIHIHATPSCHLDSTRSSGEAL